MQSTARFVTRDVHLAPVPRKMRMRRRVDSPKRLGRVLWKILFVLSLPSTQTTPTTSRSGSVASIRTRTRPDGTITSYTVNWREPGGKLDTRT